MRTLVIAGALLGLPLAAWGQVDAGVPDAAPDAATPSPFEALQAEVAALRALAEGELPPDEALRERLTAGEPGELVARIDALRARLEPPPAAGDAGVVDAGVGDAEPDDAAPPPEAPPFESELRALERERDALTLKLLERWKARLDASVEAPTLRAQSEADEAVQRGAIEQAAAAEAAQREALQQAEEARSATVRALAEERALVEGVRGKVADRVAADAAARQKITERAQGLVELMGRMDLARTDREVTPSDVDALYESASAALTELQSDLEKAMAERGKPSRYPEYTPRIDADAAPYREHPEAREALKQAISQLAKDRAAALPAEAEQRDAQVSALVEQARALNQGRLRLLPYMSRGKREAVLGLGPVGWQQARSELRQLRLLTRWYLTDRLDHVDELGGWLTRVFTRASLRGLALQSAFLFFVLFFAFARRARLRRWFDDSVAKVARKRMHPRLFARRVNAVRALARDAALLLVAWYGVALAEGLAPIPEVVHLGVIVLGLAWYRLLLTVGHQFLVTAASRPHRVVPQDLGRRIRRSLAVGGFYVLLVWIYLYLAAFVVGRGQLYSVVLNSAWLGAFPIAWLLLHRWRPDITRVYLELFPSTPLAARIDKGKPKPALVWMIPAAARLTVHGVSTWLGNFALRFDRTRRAVSYLFMRDMRRRAASEGDTAGQPLPDELVAAFTGLVDVAYRRRAEADPIRQAIKRLDEEGRGFTAAVVSDRGAGSTHLLAELARRPGERPVVRIDFQGPVRDAEAVCAELSRAFGLAPITSVDNLVRALRQLPPTLALIDDVQHLVLRAAGGREPLDALGRVLRRTSRHLGWVITSTSFIWAYVHFATRGEMPVGMVVHLERWSEEEITAMIDARMRSAGYEARFDGLLDDDNVTGRARELELLETKERFMRVLWNYSDGTPGLACHFWLSNLEPLDGRAVRVRPFRAPDPDQLEKLGERGRFTLLALTVHDALTVEEVTRVLQLPLEDVRAQIGWMVDRGYVSRRDGLLRLTADWNRAIVRYLRRKHLLHG